MLENLFIDSMDSNPKVNPFPLTPFDEAEDKAHAFGFNMVYSITVLRSLEVIEATQREYELAVKQQDKEMIERKQAELDFFLNALRLSSILELENGGHLDA